MVKKMADEMRTKLDYEAISKTLIDNLHLRIKPVAVKFAKSEDAIPENVPEIEEAARHCQMVVSAGKEDKIFYAKPDKHLCAGGAWALGLKELTPTLQSGEFYYKLGKFDTWAACSRTISSIPRIKNPVGDEPVTYASLYAPLDKTPFDPHVVVVIAQPIALLKFAQSSLYHTGGRIYSEFSGIQSVCADACAQPYMTGNSNVSLGCDGSRKFSGIDDDLMVMGIPVEKLDELATALPIITGAAGSKK
ncbi:protein of unknown function DUF169 [Methanoplanus limicola DSM 2279]|uniref:DUF169 domain-containing protein n=2 Tax=Methanoplanus limicola TaxID=2315 RepID=H1YZ04_9EURY|nr:protein of unknown function DUF169 [Methanoplanus limicola DSM 2279]